MSVAKYEVKVVTTRNFSLFPEKDYNRADATPEEMKATCPTNTNQTRG
jgi:hypothetical protein